MDVLLYVLTLNLCSLTFLFPQLIWNEKEFKIVAVKPGDAPHRMSWMRETEHGEVLFYQLDGDSTVEVNGTGHKLSKNFMLRAKRGEQVNSQHAAKSICLVIRMHVEVNQESLGEMATKRATKRAQEWLQATYGVISKTVLSQAGQGLFRAVIRFEDNAPHDVVNQKALLKMLRSQDLHGHFSKVEDAFELHITWGPRV